MLGQQHRILRRVVVYNVDDALHAKAVDGVHQMSEVLHGAVIGVHRPVVRYGIRTAETPLLALLSDRMDRHQPDDVGAESLDSLEVGFDRPEGAFGRMISHIDAIDYDVPQ